jgi:hypothetical protein
VSFYRQGLIKEKVSPSVVVSVLNFLSTHFLSSSASSPSPSPSPSHGGDRFILLLLLEVPLAEASLQSNLGAAVGVLALGLDLSAPLSRSLKRASSETQ